MVRRQIEPARRARRTVGPQAIGVSSECIFGYNRPVIERIRVLSEARQQMKDVTSEVNGALRRLVPAETAYDETVRRARLYREAGANSIFAPGLVDLADLTRLVKDVVLPLNCLAWPGLPDGAALEKMRIGSKCRSACRGT